MFASPSNVFTSDIVGTDGPTASVTLELFGVVDGAIPLPAAGWLMLTMLGGSLGVSLRGKR